MRNLGQNNEKTNEQMHLAIFRGLQKYRFCSEPVVCVQNERKSLSDDGQKRCTRLHTTRARWRTGWATLFIRAVSVRILKNKIRAWAFAQGKKSYDSRFSGWCAFQFHQQPSQLYRVSGTHVHIQAEHKKYLEILFVAWNMCTHTHTHTHHTVLKNLFYKCRIQTLKKIAPRKLSHSYSITLRTSGSGFTQNAVKKL